ncbi:glycosyltransferase [Methylocystis hirsuta]|uniref:Glycosyltransferase n=1 Tax=Methylocystis hirsuta TaxID=369798 RepID=A0A3M9XP76_9HYPH|nr:glycosyltransferase [Methylocystis hirsuta]RNJ49811.1 glycosyltransferase [Methylocystis hirsuta]
MSVASSDCLACAQRPLLGRRVALIHPAWHSCGTYRVVLGQIAAYRALGAEVFPIAISSDPGFVPGRNWLWKSFNQATPELDGGARYYGGAPFHAMLSPRFLRHVLWPYLHGDQAVVRLAMAERARLSRAIEGATFDLVHCNHFFLMPIARRLARGAAPILLDTHDLQARQFALINEKKFWLSPRASYESMLAQELEAMRGADLLLHLNAQEAEDFRALVPEKAHALLYPATPEAPTGPGGPDIILVASNNAANVESVVWFLREVAPKAPGVTVKIVGNVDAGVRSKAPEQYAAYKDWFLGRVEDPGAVYANARLALLPTISGTGLSIKTVEALSSGLPLIATRQAMRGMDEEALSLPGVVIVDSAQEFADALSRTAASAPLDESGRRGSPARRYYESRLSLAAYKASLGVLAAALISAGSVE